jgi:uncharacterized membrane protein YkvA (DUF1232 family)
LYNKVVKKDSTKGRIKMPNNQNEEYKKLKKKYFWLRLLMHIPNFFKLAFRLVRDKQVPLYLKFISYAAFIYVLSPYDLIPIVLLPFIGWIEDIIIFYICMKLLVSLSPPEVVDKHVSDIDAEMKQKFRQYYRR